MYKRIKSCIFSFLILFFAILFTSHPTYAYTQSAWPTSTGNRIIVQMSGSAGNGGLTIGATTTWGSLDKTKANFVKQPRTIQLTATPYNGNPYSAILLNSSVRTTTNASGGYSIITFGVSYTVPAHHVISGNEITKPSYGSGRFVANTSFSHSAANQTIIVTYQVNLDNFGMITDSNDNRALGGVSVIRISRPNYNVTFDPAGGSCSTSSTKAACGVNIVLPNATRDGYTFNGWYDSASGGSRAGGVDDNYTVCGADQSLFAQWTADAYTIRFNANGGTCDKTSITSLSSDRIILPAAAKDGLSFLGWYTAANGGTKIGSAGQAIQLTKDQTVFAHYSQYASNGITGTPVVKFDINVDNSSGSMSATWKNLPDQGRLIVTKYDDDGKTPLEGVTFVLTSKEDTDRVMTLTTDANGEVTFDEVPCGDYTLIEAKTVKGHSLLTEPVDVTLPLSMTEQEVNAKNVDASKAFYSARYDRYHFYSLNYDVTNHATLNLPNTGMLDNWRQFVPIIIGCLAIVIGGIVYMKKKKVK